MKTLTFPAGSIGAIITPEPGSDRTAPIPIPRDFQARQFAPATKGDEHRQKLVRVGVAFGVVAVIATALYLAI